MSNGDVIAGSVQSVDGARAKIRAADGAMRVVDVRTIESERLADGATKRHPAALGKGAIAPATQALLDRLQKGEQLQETELVMLVELPTQELVDRLIAVAAGKDGKSRNTAARALALTATKEGVRAALDAAKADASGGVWKAIAAAMTNGACIGAIDGLGARGDLDGMLADKDRQVRFSCAWIAAKLGSTAALPVLAPFVGDSDHHLRESAATCLAEAGDATGAKVLITMCKRERSPVMEANKDADAATREMLVRATLRERIHSCELLGALKCKEAVPALTALAKHRDVTLAAAATKAIASINGA